MNAVRKDSEYRNKKTLLQSITVCLGENNNIANYSIGVMSRSNGFRIIAWLALGIINDDVVRGQNPGPNAIVLINGQMALDCNVSSMGSTQWIRTTDGKNNTLLIASGCTVSGNNAAYYSTEQLGGNVCRLTIGNATMQMGGVYTCFDGSSTAYWSLVAVVDPVASVVVYNQSEVVEEDQLNISCSINYNGPSPPAPSLRPSPYWTTSPGQSFTSAIDYPSSNVVTLMATVKVQKPTVPIFQCKTGFEITGNATGYNLTAPADNFTVGTTKTDMDVLYAPSEPSVTGTPAVITNNGVPCGVSVLTCSSTGNPVPNYRWYESANSNVTLSTLNTLTLGEIYRNYKCEASNTIRKVMHNVSETYTVSKVDCSSTVDCCEYPRNETTSVTVEGCDNETMCDCSQVNSEIRLICNAETFPNTSYMWIGPDGQVLHSQVYGHVTMNGTYMCTAYFNRALSNYTGDVLFTNGTNVTNVFRCSASISTSPSTTTASVGVASSTQKNDNSAYYSGHGIGWIVGVVIVCFLGINILMTFFFVGYYAIIENNSSTNDVNENMKTRRNKMRLDKRFPWLQKMLPCLNDTDGTAATSFLWVLLFVLLGTSTGIVTFPVWIGLAIKSEANDEASALNSRDNTGNKNTGNGIRSPPYPTSPTDKRTKAMNREDLYENVVLNSALHSINPRLTDSPTSSASIRGKPPPPPKNKPTVNIPGRSMGYNVNGSVSLNSADPTTYAELPIKPGYVGSTSPVQLLVTDVPNDTYAELKNA